ncbi:hypothetical protein [Bradyrhizobium sp. LHD-71]|uniref:hypothetical protein n=1 Tax=Bradyrhizobium sp. LHD-71 TaxID=3072141 RepID=UPI00280DF443|nr:hypothetical protein [Bradyrhizobium sp. LHD-71]MDQ8731649.1 hypothetical protein [Bradyrhizobium sp. LHD-71]
MNRIEARAIMRTAFRAQPSGLARFVADLSEYLDTYRTPSADALTNLKQINTV